MLANPDDQSQSSNCNNTIFKQSIHTPWQCSSGHTEGWILVTAVGGRYVTRDAAAPVQAKDQHLSAACTSLNLKKIFMAIEVILLKQMNLSTAKQATMAAN